MLMQHSCSSSCQEAIKNNGLGMGTLAFNNMIKSVDIFTKLEDIP